MTKDFLTRAFTPTLRPYMPLHNHKFIGPFIYALFVDAIDLVGNTISLAVSVFLPLSFLIDRATDIVQTTAAYVIYEDALFAITNMDFVLPAPFNMFPTYTAKVLIRQIGWR